MKHLFSWRRITANKHQKASEIHDDKLGFLNILILFLSVYVLAALLLDTFVRLPHEVSRLLILIDDIICLVFLYDFCLRFYRAKNKLRFMKWGWIDLVSS